MAIRKLRKQMKPLIWVFTIAFFISILAVVVANVRMLGKSKNNVLAINGMKVDASDIERAYNNRVELYSGYYSKAMPEETIRTIAVNDVVEQNILLSMAKKLKIKVSRKEVDEVYERAVGNIKNKEDIRKRLLAIGFTTKSFKKYIETSLIAEKVREKIQEEYTLGEGDALREYDRNKYGEYLGKEFDEVKNEIEEKLASLGQIRHFRGFVAEQKKEADIKVLDPNYEKYLEKTEFTEEGFEISNLDIANRLLIQKLYGEEDDEKARTNALEGVKKEIKIAKDALDKGLEKNTSLSVVDQIDDLINKLRWHLVETAEPSEAQLKKYFSENSSKYDTQEEAAINIVSFRLEAAERDEEEALAKANDILKKTTIDNFSDMAKEHSEGPTAVKGGDVGWFAKSMMVKEFSDAVFAGNIGEIYPEVVKTQFGYHIIYVTERNDEKQEARASHILVRAKAGEATMNEIYEDAQSELQKLKNGETDFEKLSKEKSSMGGKYEIGGIKRGTYVPEIGYDLELNEAIFASGINDKKLVKTKNGVYIFEKTKYTPFKKASYESAKDRVKHDLSIEIADAKLKAMFE